MKADEPLPDNLHKIDQLLSEARTLWLRSGKPAEKRRHRDRIDALLDRRLEISRQLQPQPPL